MLNNLSFEDKEIVLAIKEGGVACEQVLEMLYRRDRDQVLNWLQGMGCEEEEAKDIYQEALVSLVVMVRENRYEAKSKLSTFVHAICKNQWFNRVRRNKLKTQYEMEEQVDEGLEATAEDVLMNEEQSSLIDQVMDQLKGKCKQTLTLWSQKYSMREIALKLDFQNEQVARNKKSNCLKQLKTLIAENPSLRNMLQEFI